LVVEDNRMNLMLLHQLLKAHGYEILQTPEGWEAIDLARNKQPDLILVDIRLPDISGLDVTRLLKQDDRGLSRCPREPHMMYSGVAASHLRRARGGAQWQGHDL
jgi:CheY-like chemotaxis protein